MTTRAISEFQRDSRKAAKHPAAIATAVHASGPRLLGTISLWRLGRLQDPRRTEADPGGPGMMAPNPKAAVVPEAAGRAAFETYGQQGEPINPHSPGSRDRADWAKGFGRAAAAKVGRDR